MENYSEGSSEGEFRTTKTLVRKNVVIDYPTGWSTIDPPYSPTLLSGQHATTVDVVTPVSSDYHTTNRPVEQVTLRLV